MKVLLIGSGGREHAIFWKLSQSPLLTSLHVFPGNGGFPEAAIVKEPGLSLHRIRDLVAFIKKRGYDFVFVGPEQPLVDGLVDSLEGVCPAFGPMQEAARLEGSKNFSKEFMANYGIPTARSASFTKSTDAIEYLKGQPLPIVIKADGLAAGKGVTVAKSLDEAKRAVVEALDENRFGDSGRLVLIEDFLRGREASVFAICDGERALPFLAARDHKRAFDNDEGPNTGGMGAYAPVDFVDDAVMERVQRQILDRVIAGMNHRGTPYRGLLYAGLMIENGEPSVVEFNVRFGDPETQPLMLLLDEDLLDLSYKSATGRLPNRTVKFKDASALVIVLAASGYPDEYVKNIPLKNIDNPHEDIFIFHAGTRRESGVCYSTGGRILGVTAIGKNLSEARKKGYGVVREVQVPETFYRSDIAGLI
jgi:phosphoribosylamine--glycine ligase